MRNSFDIFHSDKELYKLPLSKGGQGVVLF